MIGCDPIVIGCDPILIGWVPIVIGCDPIVIGCVPIVIGCVPIVIECIPIVIGCAPIVIGCVPMVIGSHQITIGCERGRGKFLPPYERRGISPCMYPGGSQNVLLSYKFLFLKIMIHVVYQNCGTKKTLQGEEFKI